MGFFGALNGPDLDEFARSLSALATLNTVTSDHELPDFHQVTTALAHGDATAGFIMLTDLAVHRHQLAALNSQVAAAAETMAAIIFRNAPSE